MTWCLTKSPFLFGPREDVIEPTIKTQGVSAFSVQGHRCIRGEGVGGTRPHTLLTASPGRCDLRAGSCFPASLTIISVATLPRWCRWRPWTNTAIWIQLRGGGLSTLRVSVQKQAPEQERKRVGNFNSRVVTSTLKRRRLQRGKKWQNYWNRCSCGSVAVAGVMDIKL